MRVIVKPAVIEEWLLRSNKSKDYLATVVGRTPGYISEILNTNKSPSAKLRESLMSVLNISDWDALFEIIEEDDELTSISQPMPI